MKILDKNGQELQESDIDYELGHLEEDKIFIQHHDAIEAQEEIERYRPQTFHFEDGTSYSPQELDDPHVIIIDDNENPQFEGRNLEGEEEKIVFGISVVPYIVQRARGAEDAWDEYEDILRYIEYTPEELEERAAAKAKKEKEEAFIENGPDILEETNATVEDLVLMMADMVGGEEAE